MEKKKLITGIVAGVIGLALVGTIAYLYVNLDSQKKENKAMQELADLDKKEMENEYQQFANQYSEMKTQITNDSIVAQLTAEQEKTERLLKELRDTKSSDAREIARLKKELATVRAVLRSYVIEIDSLNRLNQNLTAENTRIKGQYNEATRQIEGLNTERLTLGESGYCSAARCHRHINAAEEQARQEYRQDFKVYKHTGQLHHSQERDSTERTEDILRAHHHSCRNNSRRRRNVPLSEPLARSHNAQECGIRRTGNGYNHVLERIAVAACRNLSCKHLR